MQPSKPGWKTSEFAVVLLVVLPGVAALIEAIQKGDTFQAALLAGINAAVGGAYAIARGMAKQAATPSVDESQPTDRQPQQDPPVIVPGPDKEA